MLARGRLSLVPGVSGGFAWTQFWEELRDRKEKARPEESSGEGFWSRWERCVSTGSCAGCGRTPCLRETQRPGGPECCCPRVRGFLRRGGPAGPPQPSPGAAGFPRRQQGCSLCWWGVTGSPFRRPFRAAERLASLPQPRACVPTSRVLDLTFPTHSTPVHRASRVPRATCHSLSDV